MGLEIRSASESNIDGLIEVCSRELREDPLHREGMERKRDWLKRMIGDVGSVAEIAYMDGRPVGMVLFYPEKSIPHVESPREGALCMSCIFVGEKELQNQGIGSLLLKEFLDHVKRGHPCLESEPAGFVYTHAFDAHVGISQEAFLTRRGFVRIPGKDKEDLYMSIEAGYQPMREEAYTREEEDRGRALVFYSPVCQFSYPFAVMTAELIREIEPDLPVDLVDEWERPEEKAGRGSHGVIVNGRPIEAFFMNKEAFKTEVKEALEEA